MAKDKDTNASKPVSRKHEARLARENRQKKLMIGIVSGILAVVILLVGFGILYDTVIKKGRPVEWWGTTKNHK